jgi:indole-3-glycerol phosphate synthase
VSVIAEIKRKSPSGGVLRPDASAADLAALYAANGAAALSVLTDFAYFGGTDADLVEAQQASGLPALRKDFVIDAYQIYEARALGATAVLLIVRSLADHELRDFLALADTLGLDALVETHSTDEVRRALDAGARIVGINNRDLDTLVTDPSLSLRLRPLIPPDVLCVAESGMREPAQVRELAQARVDAVLIGETLVKAPDSGAALRAFVDAGRASSVGEGQTRHTGPGNASGAGAASDAPTETNVSAAGTGATGLAVGEGLAPPALIEARA